MEKNFFKELPKFETPEEELDFLRFHIAKKEEELQKKGHFEHTGENLYKQAIKEYKEVPIHKVVEKENIMRSVIVGKYLIFENDDVIIRKTTQELYEQFVYLIFVL